MIDASIPLLIGNDVMVGLGISLINDVHKQESYIQIGIINKNLRKKETDIGESTLRVLKRSSKMIY